MKWFKFTWHLHSHYLKEKIVQQGMDRMRSTADNWIVRADPSRIQKGRAEICSVVERFPKKNDLINWMRKMLLHWRKKKGKRDGGRLTKISCREALHLLCVSPAKRMESLLGSNLLNHSRCTRLLNPAVHKITQSCCAQDYSILLHKITQSCCAQDYSILLCKITQSCCARLLNPAAQYYSIDREARDRLG